MWDRLQRQWFLPVNHLARHTSWAHGPLRTYAELGIVLFGLVLVIAWWSARGANDARRMAAALWTPVGALVAIALNQPLGRLVHEPRPFTVFPHALTLVARSHDFSFPSDHAVMAGAVTAGVLLVDRRLGLVTAVAALILAFARVYVGVHFPLDVVAGLAFGALITLAGYVVVRRPLEAAVGGLARTRLRTLVGRRAVGDPTRRQRLHPGA